MRLPGGLLASIVDSDGCGFAFQSCVLASKNNWTFSVYTVYYKWIQKLTMRVLLIIPPLISVEFLFREFNHL